MKKFIVFILSFIAALCCLFVGCSDGDTTGDESDTDATTEIDGNVLVVYFSATGNTENVAGYIAQTLSCKTYEITPAVPYTSDDLNYSNDDCRANREQNDDTARPEISGSVENISEYETVFIGYPIWWGKLPKIVYTFLESYDLSGKSIIPFCTSGGSGISASVTEIKFLEPNATVSDGQRFASSVSRSDVEKWVNGLNIK